MTLPDFSSLYDQADTSKLVTDDPKKQDSNPQKNDKLPDFGSLYAAPAKTIRQQNIDAINKVKNDFYDGIGLSQGAFRGFIDLIPSAIVKALGTEPEDVSSAVKQTAQGIGQLGTQLVEDPVGAGANLAKSALEGIAKPFVQYPLELLANKQIDMATDLTKLGDQPLLTPEEREQRAKGIGANAIGWAVGLGLEEAVSAKLIGQAGIVGKKGLKNVHAGIIEASKQGILNAERVAGDVVDKGFGQISVRDMMRMREAAVVPDFARRVASGAAGGASGGFATGYLEGDSSAERLSGGLTYAMVAMPMGVAMTSIGAMTKFAKPVADMPNIVAQQASNIAKLRMINAATDQTVGEILFNIHNLDITQSMAATIAINAIEFNSVGVDKTGAILQYGKNASIIPGVENPHEIMRIVAEANKDNPRALAVTHAKKDGTIDMMVAPIDMPKVEQDFFAQTGYMHGQQVGYGGRDQWVIESQGTPEGKRTPRVTLRDLVTDERVEDIRTSQLTRLSSREPGDLAVHLGRIVTRDDIWDPGQGFSAHGRNMVGFTESDPHAFTESAGWTIAQVSGKRFEVSMSHEGKAAEALRQELSDLYNHGYTRNLTDAESDRIIELENKIKEMRGSSKLEAVKVDGKTLEPGLHHIEGGDYGTNRAGDEVPLKQGVIFYVGGKKEMIDVPGPNGTIVKKEVQIGNPGEIVAYVNYEQQVVNNDRILSGSENFFSIKDSPNRSLATEAIKRKRAELGITRSFSSLSPGGAASLASVLNRFAPDRQVGGRLTVMSPEAIKTALIEDFLNYVGATPDGNFTVDPTAVISSLGVSTGMDRLMTHRGEALSTMKNRLGSYRLSEMRGQSAQFFTDTKQRMPLETARILIDQQTKADVIPTTRTVYDRMTDRTPQSFNSLVAGFVEQYGIRPEVVPAVRGYIESQIGKSLLGMESARSRLADRSLLPMLKDQVNRAAKVVEKLERRQKAESGLGIRDTDILNEAIKTRDIFNARIKQIENAPPLPFSEQEKSVYTRLMKEAQDIRKQNANDLASTAISNGFVVERENGVITLRDAESNQLLPQKFVDAEAATDFINQTGRSKAIDIDNGGNNVVPPSSVASVGMLPPEPPPRFAEVPHAFAPDSRIAKVMTFLDSVAPWMTPKRAFMVAMDNSFKTRFHDEVYLPLQTAKMRVEAMKRPFLLLVKDIEDHLIQNKIPRERWKLVTQYRESMAPQEIVDHLFTDRKLTNAEVGFAGKLVKDNIDIQNVYGYRRATMEIKKQFDVESRELDAKIADTQDPASKLGYQTMKKKLTQDYMVDIDAAKNAFNMDDKHLAAVQMFDDIVKRDINEVSLEGVTRLAKAVMNKEVSRPDFAAAHKMTPAEIKAGQLIDTAYSAVAKHLKIDERITNYFNHFRSYTEIPDTAPASLRKAILRGVSDDLPALAQEMIRSGEMNPYELDPVKALTQYVSTAFNNRHFNETWRNTKNAAIDNLKKITKGRDAAAKVIDEYVSGMKNVPAASDELGQAALDKFMQSMGFEYTPDLKRGIVNTYLAASSGAMLGFRPAQGIRDFTQFAKIYFSRFGMSRFNNGMKLAYQRDANGVRMIEKLAQEGTVPGLSVLQFASEDEIANGIAGKAGRVREAIFAASEKGLKLSGQHNAYALSHAIAYLDTRDLASKTLLELSRGNLTKEKAYKKLGMNSYDLPIAQGFDRLVTEGKNDQAVEYLAQATGAETAFIFGLQNHPLGWGTAVGKLAGQFGTWSVWARNYLTRLAGRGTAGERAASMARFATAEVATGLAGKALGFNMRSWYLAPGTIFLGGPAFDYLQRLEDMAGIRGRQRQAFAERQMMKGPIPLIGQLVPGNSAFNDYYQAYQLSQQRYGPIPVLGRGLGFQVDQSGRSLADEMMGNYPQTSSR